MQTSKDIQQFAARLKISGLRSSKTRLQIFRCLSDSVEPLTIQQIISYVDESHFVSVYRSLDAMSTIGVLKRVPIGLKYRYELSDDFKPHHHHVTCEDCGLTYNIASDEMENLMDKLTIDAGLKPTRHHFEAYGVCGKH